MSTTTMINTEFQTEGGAKLHIAEMLGHEAWITTTMASNGDAQTVVIPWPAWQEFLDRMPRRIGPIEVSNVYLEPEPVAAEPAAPRTKKTKKKAKK